MYKSSFTCLIAGAVIAFALPSEANEYSDLQLFPSGGYVAAGGSLSSTFDITDDGFTPGGSEIVQAAFFQFSFVDKDKSEETWSVSLEGLDGSSQTDSGTMQYFDFSFLFGNAQVLLAIQDSGTVDYTVSSSGDDFWLSSALMIVTTDGAVSSTSTGVPDGGATLVLLGAGMLGLYGIRRRLF